MKNLLLAVMMLSYAVSSNSQSYIYLWPLENQTGIHISIMPSWCPSGYLPEKITLITEEGETFYSDTCINACPEVFEFIVTGPCLKAGLITMIVSYPAQSGCGDYVYTSFFPGCPKKDTLGELFTTPPVSGSLEMHTISGIKGKITLAFQLSGRIMVTIKGGSGNILFKKEWGANKNTANFGEKFGPIVFSNWQLTQYPKYWNFPHFDQLPFYPMLNLDGLGWVELDLKDECSITIELKLPWYAHGYQIFAFDHQKWGQVDTLINMACNKVILDGVTFTSDTTYVSVSGMSSDSCMDFTYHEVKILEDTWVDTTFCRPQQFHEIPVMEDTIIGIPGPFGCTTYYDIVVQNEAQSDSITKKIYKPEVIKGVLVTTDTSFTAIEIIDGCEFFWYCDIDFLGKGSGNDDPGKTEVFIPEGFSPNGDGRNDYFYPQTKHDAGEILVSMAVYNQLGSSVWERKNFPTNAESYGWDGVGFPEGLYFWQAQVHVGSTETIRRGTLWLKH